MLSLTLLRHGRTEADDDDRYESRFDARLTDKGRTQAQELLEIWRLDSGRRFEAVVSSPLRRAMDTSRVFAEFYGVPVVSNDLLLEIDAGDLSGMKRSDGMAKYPPPAFSGPYDRIVKGSGESEAQLHARALLAVEKIVNTEKERCLVVAHGMILNAIVRAILGMPLPINGAGARFSFTDLAFMDLTYERRSHQWTVQGFGAQRQ